jgi:hypothetical protein
MIDITDFRVSFPEFTDPLKFTDDQITYWASIAECATDQKTFGCMYKNVLYLYTAHTLSIAFKNGLSSIPGQGIGLTSSKSVGSVSTSYDTNSIIESGGGHWNETSYGREYLRLVRLFGSGVRQVGGRFNDGNFGYY